MAAEVVKPPGLRPYFGRVIFNPKRTQRKEDVSGGRDVNSSRFLKLVSVALRMSSAPIVLAWFWVWLEIVRGPLSPDPSTQRVVPASNHDYDVYITVLQNNLLHWLFFAGIALGFLS